MRDFRLVGLSIAFAAALAAPSPAQQASGPSFDCARAAAPDEKQICADEKLAELDRVENAAYRQAMNAAPAQGFTKQETQKDRKGFAKDSLADRRACGAAAICILDAQVAAIDYFSKNGSTIAVPPWVGDYRQTYARQHPEIVGAALPKALGHCVRAKITSLTDRAGDPLKPKPPGLGADNGVVVDYTHGGHGVSYEYDSQAAQARVGDEVLLCLSSIPRDCPPGDDRGRFYSATDLRTGGSWMLLDSQHMCGGA